MISNIFFLIIFFFTVTSGTQGEYAILFTEHPGKAFLLALGVYVTLLAFLYFLNHRRKNKDRLIFFDNILLLGYFLFFYYIAGAQRYLPVGHFLSTLFAICLYFLALGLCHYAQNAPEWNRKHAQRKAWTAIRFLIPFCIPLLIFMFLDDFTQLFPFGKLLGIERGSYSETMISLVFSVLSIVLVLIFFPLIVIKAWQCPPMEDEALQTRLDQLCEKANFKHAGLKIWTIMEEAYTAAIIGVVAPFRYVMFTKKLLLHTAPEHIEAILAHEIGHNRYRHLILYPFILLGMLVFGALFADKGIEIIHRSFDWGSSTWDPFLYLVLFLGAIALYFRLVFGYFSRLFERQADLHALEVGLPADNIIGALDAVGVYSGNIHNHPSWHHFSIQERIDFLEKTKKNPELIQEHHRLVWISLAIYFLILFIVLFFNF